jgi:Ca2+-binding RTX toxin-like protein
MAIFKTQLAFNINKIDLHFFYANAKDIEYQNDVTNLVIEGVSYPDGYAIRASNGSVNQFLVAYGRDITVDANKQPTGGTVNVLGEINVATNQGWGVTGIGIAMVDIFSVLKTAKNADDLALLSVAFAGNDDVTLSGRVDVFNGYAGNDVLRGLAGADTLRGGTGDDTLIGSGGADFLIGNAGADHFQYDARRHGADTVKNFGASDSFVFTGSGFGGLAAGELDASMFRARATNKAVDANDHFIFRTTDDTLWFDGNGNKAGGLFLIADLTNDFKLTASDILIV